MKFNPKKPYNELPLLPPQSDIETSNILKKAITANKKLAELKGLVNVIPNQQIFINTLILNEARDSSEIENIVTTKDKIYQAFSAKMEAPDPATKEVMRYREALWSGYNELKKRNFLTVKTILNAHKLLVGNDSGVRKVPGTKLQNERTGEVIYTPPENYNIITNKLSNLEEFINSENQYDPLIKLAVMHYQFEAIHPFSDGNGRIGRILNVLYLINEDLLKLPILYLSSYIINNKADYYKRLLNVTRNNEWEKWILYILEAVERTSDDTIKVINKIEILFKETIEEVKNKLPHIYSKELVELLFYRPYCKIQYLTENNIAKRETASKYLKELERIGLLKSKKVGKEKLFLNIKLYNLWGSS